MNNLLLLDLMLGILCVLLLLYFSFIIQILNSNRWLRQTPKGMCVLLLDDILLPFKGTTMTQNKKFKCSNTTLLLFVHFIYKDNSI